jgi:L-threonylcarbamoyladenylate synthase
MSTAVLPADSQAIERAARVLRSGGLVAFPTETVYGLAANALDASAVAKIFTAKGRPSTNPLIVHVASVSEAVPLTANWPSTAQALAERFWPGPLTVVVSKSDRIVDLVAAGGPTIALRVPAHPVAQALLRVSGLPLAAPSANRSSGLSPTRVEHVVSSLEGRIDLILDGGPTPGGIESTVVDVTRSPPRLLRPGPITPSQIEAVVGAIQIMNTAGPGQPLRSPGLLARHYAPQTPLETAGDDGLRRVTELRKAGLRVGWLTFGDPAEEAPTELAILAMPTEPMAYAAQLYMALHVLDYAKVDRIVVALPPMGEAWLAIHDRLNRAATRGSNPPPLPVQ